MSRHHVIHSYNEVKEKKVYSRPRAAVVLLVSSIAALLLSIAWSAAVGAADIRLITVWNAIVHFNPDNLDHQIIQTIRLPRVIAGALVGACFAVAGAIMQGITRNPLADSGLLGINAGAGFVIALSFAFYPGLSFIYLMFYSFVGAGLGATLVYDIGSLTRGGLTPIRLVLAGAALSSLLVALSEALAFYYNVDQDIAFWNAGGTAGTKWMHIKIIFPWIAAAMIGALALSHSITLLSLGSDIAKGLGQHTSLVKLLSALVVLILAGASVSVIGAIGFIGLIIPHLARYVVGVDYRWIIPCSAVLGSLLVVLSDLAARMINPPHEAPVNAVIALIGVPFFLYLARKERREL
ncbi:ferrichrome ABC transporter permease [Paenibacillus sp. FSL H8-0548]|uniref:FecCD family ABC transporter permease n=1 Tax=Paenibacillus sp. FSL H8-0548 TaxID=1920422 RepID=UPI00096F2728|nr:iron ABC transporter permease [Paenibacillus sp. FSL H8-0548]OMF23242.1 ferrichrome ABC transporter permease [Paenibacillus sp. FSL H8-0548]